MSQVKLTCYALVAGMLYIISHKKYIIIISITVKFVSNTVYIIMMTIIKHLFLVIQGSWS